MRPARTMMIILVPIILAAASMAAGCTGAGSNAAPMAVPGTTTAGADTTSAIMLTVNGSVDQPLELRLSDLNTYPTDPVNMSAIGSGRDMNRTGSADMAGFNRTNGTGPADGNGNWQPGMGGNMPAGAGGSTMTGTGGNMPGGPDGHNFVVGQDGSLPSGNSGGFVFNTENLTGISLYSLLDTAEPADSATNVTFIGAGDRVGTVSLAEIRAQKDAAIVVTGTGMLRAIVPGTGAGTMIGITAIIVS